MQDRYIRNTTCLCSIQGARKEVLACEADPAELHRLLTNLPVLGHLTADELCCQATSLLRQYPPSKLAADARLQFIWSVQSMQIVDQMPVQSLQSVDQQLLF